MESVNSNIDQKLLDSSLNGDLEGVVDALAQGGRVAMRNHQGATPFTVTVEYGHTDIWVSFPRTGKIATLCLFLWSC